MCGEDLSDCRVSQVVHPKSVKGNVAKESGGGNVLDGANQPQHAIVVAICARDRTQVVEHLPCIASCSGNVTSRKGLAEGDVEHMTDCDSCSCPIVGGNAHLSLKRDGEAGSRSIDALCECGGEGVGPHSRAHGEITEGLRLCGVACDEVVGPGGIGGSLSEEDVLDGLLPLVEKAVDKGGLLGGHASDEGIKGSGVDGESEGSQVGSSNVGNCSTTRASDNVEEEVLCSRDKESTLGRKLKVVRSNDKGNVCEGVGLVGLKKGISEGGSAGGKTKDAGELILEDGGVGGCGVNVELASTARGGTST